MAYAIDGQICETCWLKTIDFHSFYTTIEKAQNNFILKISKTTENSICLFTEIKMNSIKIHQPATKIKDKDWIYNDDNDGQSKLIKTDDSKHQSKKSATFKQKTVNKNKYDAQIREYFQMNCDLCQITLNSFVDAQSHYRINHGQSGYLICCGQKFNRRRSIIEHLRHHINPFKRFE